MEANFKIIIIGGGLAGLTSAIHLSKMGLSVMVIEKNNYPKHKVCGEYVSNEVLPYLKWLDLEIKDLAPTAISKLQFSTVNGKEIKCDLPLGGFGVSRFALELFLYQKAIRNGCQIIHENAEAVHFDGTEFTVKTSQTSVLKSNIVIGAFGKRSSIDLQLNRDFIHKKAKWLAVKAHYVGRFPNDLVGLHNFDGGYCGVSKVENSRINICYLADYTTFKKHKNIEEYQKRVVCQNPHLKDIFDKLSLEFEKPVTISQISFEKKKAVENHILMIGDTAGLIHPLCGNGMAMAIHSAKIVSELLVKFYSDEVQSRSELEKKYNEEWNRNFKKRLQFGRFLGALLQKKKLTNLLQSVLIQFPFLLSKIIKKTHGEQF